MNKWMAARHRSRTGAHGIIGCRKTPHAVLCRVIHRNYASYSVVKMPEMSEKCIETDSPNWQGINNSNSMAVWSCGRVV